MTNITFLGLGAMGSRMAAQLVAADHSVTVWNRSTKATEALVAKGAKAASSPAEAVQNAEVVISMVRDDEASQYVWLDDQVGALHSMPKGAIAIESSTLTPAWVNTLAKECKLRGIVLADAPVAGSRPQAEAAQLIFFVGGDDNTFTAIQDILLVMAGSVHHCGPIGTGATLKLALNALFGVQLAALAELLCLLKSSELEPQKALDIISATPVCSIAAKMAGAAMIAEQYSAAFPIELVEKDFRYIEATSIAAGASLPLSGATLKILQQAITEGYGGDNITGIAQLYSL